MKLLEIHVDLSRVADALEKIAFLLEKLVFEPPRADIKVQQATVDDLHMFAEEDAIRMQAEQLEFAERTRTVPGSPAMRRAVLEWEDQQRNIHGEKWQAPSASDWRSLLAAIERTGGVRESSEAPASAGQRSVG